MKQSFKRLLAVIFAITMVLGIVPFMSEPVEAAAKVQNTIIYMDGDECPSSMINSLKSEVNGYAKKVTGKSSNTTAKPVNNSSDFVNAWNAMPNDQEVVVIVAHGEPGKLMGSNKIHNPVLLNATSSDMAKLQKKSIKTIVLISCNAGHYDKRTSNIARMLADRMNATVIASDGTVEKIWGPSLNTYFYKSLKDTTWESYRPKGSKR